MRRAVSALNFWKLIGYGFSLFFLEQAQFLCCTFLKKIMKAFSSLNIKIQCKVKNLLCVGYVFIPIDSFTVMVR